MFGIVLIYGGIQVLDDVALLSFFISNPCSYITEVEKLVSRVIGNDNIQATTRKPPQNPL
ncbi:MAG: hypothetical protein DRR19_19495 [Candidatus Parabeggiatoa sp. nov. 1]|nr:MAG: hypothetical protein DRR19_19495 [Gammaproteobacteria bacterium]